MTEEETPRRRSTLTTEDTPAIVCVCGGGSFGTAMATVLGRKHHMVRIFMRDEENAKHINTHHKNMKYLKEYELPETIVATTNPAEAFKDVEFVVLSVPVQQTTKFLEDNKAHIPENAVLISTSKGLKVDTLDTMAEIIPNALGRPNQPTAFFSGPTFAKELVTAMYSAAVIASKSEKIASRVQYLFASHTLRTYTTTDVIGVEYGGALKNVIAIASGIVTGLELGHNSQAAIVTRGCSEIRRVAVAAGGNPHTLAGLSGIGDLMLTCYGALSRNRSVGVRLGQGETIQQIIDSMSEVAEGVATAPAVAAVARKYNCDVPIIFAVAKMLEGAMTPKEAITELMSRALTEET